MRSGSTEFTEWFRMKNRKSVTVVSFLITAVLGFVVGFYLYGGTMVASFQKVPISSFESSSLEITPIAGSEMWTIDDSLYIYGTVQVNNRTNEIEGIRIGDIEWNTTNSPLIINTLDFVSGNYNLYANSETIQLVLVRTNLIFYRLSLISSILYCFLSFAIASIIALYLLVMRPLAIEMHRYQNEPTKHKDANLDDEKLSFLINRVDEIRASLNNQIEHHREQKAMLLTTVAIIVSGYGVIITLLLSTIKDFYIQVILISSFTISTGFLCIPFYYLLSEHSIQRPEGSLWTYEGVISRKLFGINPFQEDVKRVNQRIKALDNKSIYEEVIVELTYLLYEYRLIVSQFKKARKWTIVSFMILITAIILGLTADFWFAPYIYVIFGFATDIIAIIAGLWIFYRIYNIDMTIERLELYGNADLENIDFDWNSGFKEIEGGIGAVVPHLIDTSQFEESDWSSLAELVENNTRKRGRPSTKRKHIYGSKKDEFNWCGREVPILVVRKAGEKTGVEIYPYCGNDGTIITIKEYIQNRLKDILTEG